MQKHKADKQRQKCGIIMPISEQAYAGLAYSVAYWASLKQFLCDAIKFSGFDPQPMWEDPNESSITPRIVANIKSCPLALCVISACNPNVMIELGMRLFADKPVLVIYDDSIRRLPFDINDLEAYKIPYRPLYAEYGGIRCEIKERLCRMSKPDYKTYLSRYKNQMTASAKSVEKQNVTSGFCVAQVERSMPTWDDFVGQMRSVNNDIMSPKTLQGKRLSVVGPTFPLGPTGAAGEDAVVN